MTDDKDVWKLGISLPYYPTNEKHQKSGILEVGREFLVPSFSQADKIKEEMDRARDVLISEWIKLAKAIENNPFIHDRIRMKIMNEQPITNQDIQDAINEDNKHTEEQKEKNKNTSFNGPSYMFLINQKTDAGVLPVCGYCLYCGKTKELDLDKDIDYCVKYRVPMAMCFTHRKGWFDTKSSPDRRAEMRNEINDIYKTFKAREDIDIREGIKE